MKLYPEERETIGGVSAALRAAEITCAEVLKSCIANIERWEPNVHAWVHLDLERAARQAEGLDADVTEGKFRGPLHGIPIGIKDIIDVKGMPTGCGSRLWKDRIAERDARIVAELRNAGAIILGKTVTTAYAWIDPPITRNPWNLERTPGGSSSGSAAAVATGMCLGAIGTQTGGSIIRPASFCGVAGFKPTYSSCSFEAGVLPFAPSLDHVGPIARSVSDLQLLFQVVHLPGYYTHPSVAGQTLGPPPQSTLGLLGEAFWERAEASMKAAFEEASKVLQSAGAKVVTVDERFDFNRIIRSHRTIMASEAAANHRDRLNQYPDDYPPQIQSLIEEGTRIPAIEYVRAKQLQDNALDLEGRPIQHEYAGLFRLLEEVDFIATPATLGPAPNLTTTGHPAFNSPWSFFGLPAVTFPIGLAPDGLPLGIQLIAAEGKDHKLLALAAWCERTMRDALNARGT
jgi:aspartyl-tRNA(Asn)/glutamyl-tRNA(Gln) amidotransferase subunit A